MEGASTLVHRADADFAADVYATCARIFQTTNEDEEFGFILTIVIIVESS